MGRLDGKVAFISGVARGQGRSHAVRMAQEGADIIGFDVCENLDTLEYGLATADDLATTVAMVEDTDRRIVAEKADVRDRSQVEAVLSNGLAMFGRVDFVVANAGIMPILGESADTDKAWHDAVDVMLTGVYYTVDSALAPMIERGEGGAIVITSSSAGLRGFNLFRSAGGLAYVAAKHGVVGLMRAWANQLGPYSIRVNTVHPTGTRTPMIDHEGFANFVAENPGVMAAMSNALPVDMLEPTDISNSVVFLCSDEGRYITGTTLPVDAGVVNK